MSINAELVALAQNCLTKYGHSVLADIINADVCPHYFFEGVILGIIEPDVSFCKDPEKVKEMKAFLKEHVTKEQRQVAKAVNFGCPGCMGPARLYQHLRENGLKVTRKEAEDLLNCWLSTFPEMNEHFNSRPAIKFDPYARYGIKTEIGEGVELEEDPFKEKRKTRKLFRAQTITGFVRNRATQNAACNCDFQNPVAHLAKEALWNLESAGLGDRLFCFVHVIVLCRARKRK